MQDTYGYEMHAAGWDVQIRVDPWDPWTDRTVDNWKSPYSFRLISTISSHPTVFFSHNKPANSTFSTINQRNEQSEVSGVDSECAVAVAGKGGTCGHSESDTVCMQMLEGAFFDGCVGELEHRPF
jgi:hypothetical protein